VVLVKVPEVPVMVTVEVPTLAAVLAVSVSVLVLAVLAGLKEAVTPAGKPEADKLTLPVKPFCGATVTVLVPLAPCMMLRLLGVAESEKLGGNTGAVTVRETVVVFVKVPEFPVMVTLIVPVMAVLLAASVNVLELVVPAGLKVAVTPLGNPEADKLTLPVKPFCGVTEMVLAPLVPCTIDKALGDAEREKFGGTTAAVTVRLIVAVFVKFPEFPVMVTVAVPVVAVLLAVSDNVLVFVVLAGLKDAVTPLGRPEADRLTLPLKPFRGVTVIVLVALAPCAKLKVAGEAESA
jgi:hypothetical protein